MGKSTSDKLLRDRGISVIDTDIIARQLVEPEKPALSEIVDAFGTGMIDGEGRLRREELARLVFEDPGSRQMLEDILHPRIRAVWTAQVEAYRKEGQSCVVVVIPLLFETNAAPSFDAIICVACSATTQFERLLQRGWNPEHVEKRIRAQWPVDKKMNQADYVVWTEGDLEIHAKQLARIFPLH